MSESHKHPLELYAEKQRQHIDRVLFVMIKRKVIKGIRMFY